MAARPHSRTMSWGTPGCMRLRFAWPRNPADAEDVLQETLLKAFAGTTHLQGRNQPQGLAVPDPHQYVHQQVPQTMRGAPTRWAQESEDFYLFKRMGPKARPGLAAAPRTGLGSLCRPGTSREPRVPAGELSVSPSSWRTWRLFL